MDWCAWVQTGRLIHSLLPIQPHCCHSYRPSDRRASLSNTGSSELLTQLTQWLHRKHSKKLCYTSEHHHHHHRQHSSHHHHYHQQQQQRRQHHHHHHPNWELVLRRPGSERPLPVRTAAAGVGSRGREAGGGRVDGGVGRWERERRRRRRRRRG